MRAALVAATVATGSERREASIDLLIVRTCNACDFAAKITHMTIATNLWRENYRRAIDVVTIAVAILIVDVGIMEVFVSSDKKKTFFNEGSNNMWSKCKS